MTEETAKDILTVLADYRAREFLARLTGCKPDEVKLVHDWVEKDTEEQNSKPEGGAG